MYTVGHWIDGKVANSTSGRSGVIFDPATGEQQGSVGLASVDVLPSADVVVSSLTKYAGSEGDVMAGALAQGGHGVAVQVVRPVLQPVDLHARPFHPLERGEPIEGLGHLLGRAEDEVGQAPPFAGAHRAQVLDRTVEERAGHGEEGFVVGGGFAQHARKAQQVHEVHLQLDLALMRWYARRDAGRAVAPPPAVCTHSPAARPSRAWWTVRPVRASACSSSRTRLQQANPTFTTRRRSSNAGPAQFRRWRGAGWMQAQYDVVESVKKFPTAAAGLA